MHSDIIYSIIIPHYNIPYLLIRCLNSIPERSDLQVIVVDDGSTSDNRTELKRWESIYSYVEFYYLDKSIGGGGARNYGLSKVQGKYVLFADSDDFFNPCLNDVLNDYLNCKDDIIYFNVNSLDTDSYLFRMRCYQVNYFFRIYDKKHQKAQFYFRYAFGEPWAKLVKREIIEKNQISFEETKIHNDTRYSYLVGYYSQSIAVDRRALYCVTERKGSVSKQRTAESWIITTQVFANANRFFREHKINRRDSRAYRGLMEFFLRKDWRNFRRCITVLNQNGESILSILFSFMSYPFMVIIKLIRQWYSKFLLRNEI